MKSLLFYLIIFLILLSFALLFFYKKQHARKNKIKKRAPMVDFGKISSLDEVRVKKDNDVFEKAEEERSVYDPNLIVLQLSAFPGEPYMGYELHQALLASGLRFGDMNIFHRYDDGEKGDVLFSLAAATKSGVFHIEDMGSFKCGGLMMFMRLNSKQKLMSNFDLMLDTARQLTEELGGDIYDDLHQSISADVIKRLREKICEVETKNMYAADLLDNLD